MVTKLAVQQVSKRLYLGLTGHSNMWTLVPINLHQGWLSVEHHCSVATTKGVPCPLREFLQHIGVNHDGNIILCF